MIDPIVEEVRRRRDEHAKSFNYDLAAICADLRSFQSTCGHKIVRLQSRPARVTANLKHAQ